MKEEELLLLVENGEEAGSGVGEGSEGALICQEIPNKTERQRLGRPVEALMEMKRAERYK